MHNLLSAISCSTSRFTNNIIDLKSQRRARYQEVSIFDDATMSLCMSTDIGRKSVTALAFELPHFGAESLLMVFFSKLLFQGTKVLSVSAIAETFVDRNKLDSSSRSTLEIDRRKSLSKITTDRLCINIMWREIMERTWRVWISIIWLGTCSND